MNDLNLDFQIGDPYLFTTSVADLPLSDMTAAANLFKLPQTVASLKMDFFPQNIASSNTDFFPQTLAASLPDMDFFAMADHALANAPDTANVGDVINHHSDAVLDNFLNQFQVGPLDDFQVY